MQSLDSQGTITVTESGEVLVDGVPACARCLELARSNPRHRIKPRRPYPATPGAARRRQFYGYCQACNRDYNRDRREGKVQVLLTPDEWAMVKAARSRPARGRHSAALR